MHHNNEVSVFIPAQDGQAESPAGVGWLVTPSVVLMRLPERGATLGQPSHITVPAASGGGRGDQIPVLSAYDSDVLAGWQALQLERDCSAVMPYNVPEGIDLSIVSADDVSLDITSSQGARGSTGGDVGLDGWVCRCFPRLPGCR